MFAGEEVLEMAVHQSLVAQLLALERLHAELPSSLHVPTIIIFQPEEAGRRRRDEWGLLFLREDVRELYFGV